MKWVLSPRRTGQFFAGCTIFLLSAHVCIHLCNYYAGNALINEMANLFHLGREDNIPALYSAFTLFLCSVLLMEITLALKSMSRPCLYWFGLSVIFGFLSLDEAVSLHERIIRPLRLSYNLSGLFYFSWVIPYTMFLFIFVASYIKFLVALPPKTAKLFMSAGAVYVSGSLGMEMISGRSLELSGVDIKYAAYSTLEEALEMAGIALFLYALVLYIHTELKRSDGETTEPQSL